MNFRKFFFAAVAVFIIIQITDFIFHNIIQAETYNSLKHIWRPDMMDTMWIMFVVAIVFSVFFVYIFIKGFAAGSIMAGIKYGIIMSFMHPFISALSQYSIYPLPFNLVLQWYIFGVIQLTLCGMIVSLIYKVVPAPKTGVKHEN